MTSKLIKAGYLFIGIGIGVFASSFVLAREFDKPIGDIEEFIPEDDYDISDDSEDGTESSGHSSKDSKKNSTDIRERRGEFGEGRYGRSGSDNGGEETHQEFNSNQSQILDYYKSNEAATRKKNESNRSSETSRRRKEFDAMREEGIRNLKTRYSKMFKSDQTDHNDREMTDILHEVSSKTDSKDSYNMWDRSYAAMYMMDDQEDDSPPDDTVDEYPPDEFDIHDEYTLERVEENIEIYLDDNPQEFVTVVYYQGDSTLCDDGEQIIPNPEEEVGVVALKRLVEGGPGADNGIIFVHNLRTNINYEVVLDMGCYSETVLGMFEERHSRLNNGGGLDGSSR